MNITTVPGNGTDFDSEWFFIQTKLTESLEQVIVMQEIEDHLHHSGKIALSDILRILDKPPAALRYLNKYACKFVREKVPYELSDYGYYESDKGSIRFNTKLNQFLLPKPTYIREDEGRDE